MSASRRARFTGRDSPKLTRIRRPFNSSRSSRADRRPRTTSAALDCSHASHARNSRTAYATCLSGQGGHDDPRSPNRLHSWSSCRKLCLHPRSKTYRMDPSPSGCHACASPRPRSPSGEFTVSVSILPQSRADDGADRYGQTSLLVGYRSGAKRRWIEAGRGSASGHFVRRRYSACGVDSCRIVYLVGQPTMSPAARR